MNCPPIAGPRGLPLNLCLHQTTAAPEQSFSPAYTEADDRDSPPLTIRLLAYSDELSSCQAAAQGNRRRGEGLEGQ